LIARYPAQQAERVRIHPYGLARRRGGAIRRPGGVEDDLPRSVVRRPGQVERSLFGARVDQQQERIVHDAPPARIGLGDRVTVQEHRHGPAVSVPVVIVHRAAGRGEPGDIRPAVVVAYKNRLVSSRQAAKETPPPEHRVLGAQLDKRADVAKQILVRLGADRPVDPGNLVVLAVGVVVAQLGAVHLVAAQQHRNSLGQQQGSHKIALHPGPQGQDGRVVGGPLRAAVPRAVVPEPVPVVLAVVLVVLIVIGDQVAHGEAVMAGDQVDRGERPPAVLLVQVTGPGQPDSEIAQRGVPTAPEIPDPVSVLAVPFGPQRREVPDLVAALAHVPRFGDELDLGHHRILLDQVEERRQPVHRV
jgi:hypothetical protein